MHELAAGITTTGSRFGQTRNPYDLDRNPGGSSGGTGAAIAANFAAAGMGSDTCGSIRIPAVAQQPGRAARHAGAVESRRHRARCRRLRISADRSRARLPISRSCWTQRSAPIPADADSKNSTGHIPASYRAASWADGAVKGTRLGIVRRLFGTAPEDQEVDDSRQQIARGAEASRRGHRRRRDSGTRRSAPRQQPHQRRVQVRSRRLSRPPPEMRR